jgi:hypothetical protein
MDARELYATFAGVRESLRAFSEAEINEAIDVALKAVRSGREGPSDDRMNGGSS